MIDKDKVLAQVHAAALRGATPTRMRAAEVAIAAGIESGVTYRTARGKVLITDTEMCLVNDDGETLNKVPRSDDSDEKLLAMVALAAGRR